MKKTLLVSALFAFLPLFCAAAPAGRSDAAVSAPTANAADKQTAIRPRVTDAATGRGVAGATVVVCEADARFTADRNGDLPVLSVPYLEDGRFPASPYGRLTLIVYAEGYRPTVLVDCVTYPHRTRLGPEISVFADEGDSSPLTVVETPPDAWVSDLVRAFPQKAH